MLETDSLFDVITKNYCAYAKYINIGGRTVPYVKDTLKTVQRRVLLAAHDLTKNGSFTKSARIVGHVIGQYHPHGDSSAYETMVNMVHDGLVDGQGSFGTTYGIESIEASAMRYTEARLNPFIKHIAFKYIDYVPTYLNELETREPVYLPTMLPLNLIQFSDNAELTSGIGVGIKYQLPMFPLKEGIDFMKKLISDDKTLSARSLPLVYKGIRRPLTEPLYARGKDRVPFTGKYDTGKSKKEFTITTFPPNKSPMMIIDKFGGVCVDKSKNGTDVLVKLQWGKSIDDYDIDSLLTNDVSFDLLFHDNEYIRRYNIVGIFMEVYSGYREAVLTSLMSSEEMLNQKILDLQDMIKIKPHLNPLDKNTVGRVVKATNMETTRVKKLLSFSVETICSAEKFLDEKKKEVKTIKKNIEQIDEYCYKHYDDL